MAESRTKMSKSRRRGLIGTATLLTATLLPTSVAFGAIVTEDFRAEQEFPNGTIVSLDKEAAVVVKSNYKNIHNMYGAVVDEGEIALKATSGQRHVPVANSGVVATLVSTANGEIRPGDAITVNTVEGVGEKATRNGRVVGVAQTTFNDTTDGAKSATLKLDGSDKNIKVGLIPVKLGVTDYTTAESNLGSAAEQERNWVERMADSFAGKQVKPIALIAAGLVLLSGVFIATFLITSSSFASVISIGRNPFARKNIISSLIGLIVMSVAIFAGSILLAYLILKLLG